MTTVAEVKLWGNTIGAIALEEDKDIASFQYDPDFSQSGIEVSPLLMPLSNQVYQFSDLNYDTFRGLPGLLADSLPDHFGNALIDAWLAQQGRVPGTFNAIERLCYTGDRGMGALEYIPATGPTRSRSEQLQVEEMVTLASRILSHREALDVSFKDEVKEQSMLDILQIGTSAGGQRPKAVIAWNPLTNEVRSGQVKTKKGFEYWMLKFDGVSSDDKQLEGPKGYGAIEYAYSKMAQDAGITMGECRLFEENGRRHFMTRRFDRLDKGEKLHMQSLCGLAHYDYKMAGAYSYEQALLVMRQLDLPMDDMEELYRRMVFNVLARNQDDHVKNIAFLMDKSGAWSLSPAYDLTYSYNPNGEWTSRHQMSINGKRDDFTPDDLQACANTASLRRGLAGKMIDEVKQVVSEWKKYADEVGVDPRQAEQIRKVLRLGSF